LKGSDDEQGGAPEPNQEPIEMAPIPPYPSPIVDRQPKEKPRGQLVQPYQRPPEPIRPTRPFIERKPETPVVPEQPVARVMSHPETVQLPPTQEVEQYIKPVQDKTKTLTPAPTKDLTPVKEKPLTKTPERFNGKLTDQPQSVNFPVKSSETKPLNFSGPKLPKKLKFKGHPGRQRTNEQVVELLTFAQTRGAFPNGVSDQMQRYYRREYPEYFRKGRKRQTAGKIPAVRPAPINISARRAGSGS
jgi:hypothetical protein